MQKHDRKSPISITISYGLKTGFMNDRQWLPGGFTLPLTGRPSASQAPIPPITLCTEVNPAPQTTSAARAPRRPAKQVHTIFELSFPARACFICASKSGLLTRLPSEECTFNGTLIAPSLCPCANSSGVLHPLRIV